MDRVDRDAGEPVGQLLEQPRSGLPFGALVLEPVELRAEQRAGQLAQPVVGAERELLLVRVLGPAAVDDRVRPPCQVIVAGQKRPALAGGQRLGGLVAERAERADASRPAAAPLLAVRVRAVLDERQPVPVGDRRQPIHVGHLLAQVHRHDGARARRDRGLDGIGVDRPALRLHVHYHRQRSRCDRSVGGGRERQRRHDHLVAPADPERLQRHLHRNRPVHHHDAVCRALVGGEPRRELGVTRAWLRPAADLPVQHHIRHGVGVSLVDLRPGRIRLAAHAGTAVYRQNAHPILRDVLTPVRSRAYFPHCQ